MRLRWLDREEAIMILFTIALIGGGLLLLNWFFSNTSLADHVPYTTKSVTPGDPMSYVGTVGQCPFYENAGDKGCWPPSDISCNADWSSCVPKAQQDVSQPISQPNVAPTASQSVVSQPTPVKKGTCSE